MSTQLTTHQVAKLLLSQPNLPLCINEDPVDKATFEVEEAAGQDGRKVNMVWMKTEYSP